MEPRELIERLALEPHPEGGHYRRTWTGPGGDEGRPVGSAIQYLLGEGERSHWHRIDATEMWIFNAGDPIRLSVVEAGGEPRVHTLGSVVDREHEAQAVVPPFAWQSAEPLGAWSLVSCVVVPAFDFHHFELAPPGWSPS